MRIRLEPEDRRQHIVKAAMRVIERDVTVPLRRGPLATEAKCAQSLVTHYFKSMSAVEFAVVNHGVASDHIPTMAYALVNNMGAALTKEQRAQAAEYLANRS